MENTLPPVPLITDDELLHAVRALTKSAEAFRQAFLMLASGKPLQEILTEDKTNLLLSDMVITKWIEELNLDEETPPSASMDTFFN